MPQVPGLVPTADPGGGVPGIGLDVPVDAFGGAVGHALQGLGSQVEQSSDKIWQQAVNLQNLQNETEAKNADAQYMMKSGMLHADFINKEGLQAGPDALQAHIKELQDLRTSVRDGISNPMAAKMYDASSLGFMGRNIFNAAGHSGQQMKVAANGASDSRIQLAKTTIGDSPEDDINVSRMTRVIETEVDAKGRNSGWTPEQIDATKQSEVSDAVGHRIVGIAKTNAPQAQRMLDDAQKNNAITPQVAERVQATVQTQFRDQGSRVISDKVLADRRNGDEDNKPVQEYIDAALEEAKKYPTKDPLFPDYVRSRVVTDYNRQKAIETDSDNMNTRTIGQALIKGNQAGQLPTSIEELKAIDPAVGPAWDSMSRNPQKQQAILRTLEQNARGGRQTITPENLQAYQTARGTALNGTDEERAGFMSKNFATEGSMTLSQRKQLMDLQTNLQHRAAISAADDPRVSRALQFLKPDMIAAGIDPRGGEDARKDYFAFTGALQDQLDQYHKDHPGKVPSHDELKGIGAQLMQEQVTSKGWLWDDKASFYKMPVPDEEATRIKADPYWKNRNVVPNEGMIARIYRAEQFKERYGGSAKKPAEAAFPPNSPEPPVSQ
jgi:hypothetical protein